MKLHASGEDYLESVLVLQKKLGMVRSVDVARHVETVVLLSHKSPDSVINVKVEFGESDDKISLDAIAERAKKYQPKPKITYKITGICGAEG